MSANIADLIVEPIEHRQWWPHAYLDEYMPAGRNTPDAWLCRLGNGANAYGDQKDGDWPPAVLSEGEIITFSLCDWRGTSLLTFDGADARWEPPVPADVDHLWDGDEIIADTAGDFVDQVRESLGREDRVVARLSRWSGEPLRFRFTAEGGPPRFVPLDPIPAPPAAPVAAPALGPALLTALQSQTPGPTGASNEGGGHDHP